MDISKFNPNAPAFGVGSQKIEELSAETTQPEPIEAEVKEQAEEVQAEVAPEEEEPKRVTYSRFKNVHSRAVEAERAAEEARRLAEEWRIRYESSQKPQEEPLTNDIPNWWTELYGDSEASQKAWKIQNQANQEFQQRILEEAQERALEALRNEQVESQQRINENLNQIDTSLEGLSDYVGRELSEKEQIAVLDIVDEYAPKDKEGNYLGPTMSFEKAWDLYELKNQTHKAAKTQVRDNIAGIIGSQSQGESSVGVEQDKNFNPLDWNAWKKRLS